MQFIPLQQDHRPLTFLPKMLTLFVFCFSSVSAAIQVTAFLDAALPSSFSISNAMAAGADTFVLGFAQANCQTFAPVFGQGLAKDSALDLANQIRSGGGEVIISFGGVLQTDKGTEPAVCASKLGKSAEQLQSLYQEFVDLYGVTQLDFDIESHHVDDIASINLRNKAVAGLKRSNPNLKVSYSLPVTERGFLPSALTLLNDAKNSGTNIDIVNAMTMNYGVASQVTDMGAAALSAIKGAYRQVESILPGTKLGVTPMIGPNDTPGEYFSLADAEFVVNNLKSGSYNYVGFVSIWESHRDDGNFSYLKAFSRLSPGLPLRVKSANSTRSRTGSTTLVPSPSSSTTTITTSVLSASITSIPPSEETLISSSSMASPQSSSTGAIEKKMISSANPSSFVFRTTLICSFLVLVL